MAAKNYWIVKQEPSSYSWDDFVREGKTAWTGVRNYQARNNLAKMRAGDRALFYHSGTVKAVVGIAAVARGPYPDPTAEQGEWVAVDVRPATPLGVPVTLEAIKGKPALSEISLLRQSRLSVLQVSAAEFETIVSMGDLTGLLEKSVEGLRKKPSKRSRKSR